MLCQNWRAAQIDDDDEDDDDAAKTSGELL